MPSTSLRTLSILVIFALASPTPGRPAPAPLPFPLPLPIAQNAYSGVGGHSSGGSVSDSTSSGGGLLGGGVLDVFSGNAGQGGKALSGPAFAGKAAQNGTGVANAYTGAGGVADGGNVVENTKALIRIFSGNAGKGGNAGSGAAAAGTGTGRLLRRRMIRARREFVSAVQSDETDGL